MSSQDQHLQSPHLASPPPAGGQDNERERDSNALPYSPPNPQWQNPFQQANNPFAQSDLSRRISQLPLAPWTSNEVDERRDSEATLAPGSPDPYNRYTLSSYQHPYDIPPPPNAYGRSTDAPSPRAARRSVSFADNPGVKHIDDDNDDRDDDHYDYDAEKERAQKRRGIPSQMLDLRALDENDNDREQPGAYRRPMRNRKDSTFSNNSDLLDPDDPLVTGNRARYLEDPEDIEKNTLRQMDYRSRRKHLMRVRIEFNVSSMANRQEFLLKLARALMTFGAPSHRIESQLTAAARILEVEAEFIHLPGVIICSFGDQELGCSETHFIKCGGRLSLGALHKVHLIYRAVVHDEVSAKKAAQQLEDLLNEPAMYSTAFRCFLAFVLSALICPLAFGGSFVDLWIAGAGALILSMLQLCATKSALYANVFEITAAIFVSFTARGLSSIRKRIFCYTAISSSSIIGILPGYLILSSSLELASKNIVCGSVKMVYALIYTLFLGFGLQIGSDFYLLFDRDTRHHLDSLASSLAPTVALTGSWTADNATINNTVPVNGTWTFTHAVPLDAHDIIAACYRPKSFPWYLQPFPYWSAIIIVPLFSLLSSLANLQPLKSKQLPVMVIISCASYTSNKIANHYIFNRSDIVSAIGAFTVGLLGNIYSRKMGGTAFTSMVTGVLFLVPSGLSQAGGITANGNGIDIGGAMIAVTIGITVGLFMSQALVYMFGTRKNAAVFSF